MPQAKLKDITLYYEVHGKGYPLLLVAGLGSDNSSWLGVACELAKNFRVIVFDNRGSGRSSIPDKRYSIRQMADDAVRLLDILNVKKCHVLGHSMGGYIVQEIALRYPTRVDKLILEATAPVSSKRNNSLFKDFLIGLEKGADAITWLRQWTYWLFAPKTFDKKKFIETFIRNVSRYPYAQPVIGFKRQVGAVASFSASGRLRDIKSNTLIIIGENDILITPEESMVLADNIADSSIATIKNTAHCIHLENPAEFIKTVRKFLNR